VEAIMRALSEGVGVRFSGTAGEHRAAALLRDAFRAEGVPARLQRYRFIGWLPKGTPRVRILEPVAYECSAAPLIYSSSTPAGGVTGRVVWHGRKSLISGLYEMPAYALPDADGGYLAQLVVEPQGTAIPLLNPHPIYRLPMVVIGKADHENLQGWLAAGATVTARVEIQTELIPDALAYNVIAEYRGKPDTAERIVVDAHYDTQLGTPGAYDNASGVAGLFGLLTRVQAARLPLNIDFVAVAGEEVGMHGSSYLVMDLKERDELTQVRACICLDQISAGDTLWIWAAPHPFREKVLASVREAGLDRFGPMRVDDPMPGGDLWPFHVEGVPACLYMWWRLPDYHRATDTMAKIDLEKVTGCVEAAYRLLCMHV
jgi:aminopeptidase YwaD